MKARLSVYFIALTLLASLSNCGGSNTAKAQVLPGSKDITIARLNEITDHVIKKGNGWKSILSTGFKTNLDAYDKYMKEESSLMHFLNWDDFDDFYRWTGEEAVFANKTYSLLDLKGETARVKLSLDYVGEEHYLSLIKEKGKWLLDDWGVLSPNSSKKNEAKESAGKFICVKYQGYSEEGSPFKMGLIIWRNKDKSGSQEVTGGMKFDYMDDDALFDEIKGTIKNGEISLSCTIGGFEYVIDGIITADYSEIKGEVAEYQPDGRWDDSFEFVMKKLP